MSTSPVGKTDSHLRLVSDEEALVLPENAHATDESPTVISKTPPIESPSSHQDKLIDLSRKPVTPEAIVASLRGRRLAHYELIEPIGVGGMAAVIRARDTQLDRFVALKILPPEMAQDPDNIERFHLEARAAAKLDHENIARVFFCGEDQGLHFIAFEFVEGINLRTMLEQRGRVPVAEAVRYVLQVATGLEHATTRGVVHRDVKPSNIIITPTGRAKLVDMGLARNLERRGQRDLTQSGVTLGTFDYISPEQALEPREADARSDIYSLGCTFYHLLTGQAPVPEGTPAKKLQHHQHHAPLDPRQIDPGIPDEIVMILTRMLAKSPKDRYQRPIHLVHHLMQVAQKVGAADDLPEGVLFVDTPLPGQPRSRPIVYVGAALAALVALTLILSFAPQPTPNPSPGTTVQTNKKDNGSSSKVDNGPGTTKNPIESGGRPPEIVKNRADLEAVLKDQTSREVKIGETIDLESTGILFKGGSDQRLVLETAEDREPAIIRFQYRTSSDSAMGLSLDGGKEIVFRRIRFEVSSDTTPGRAAAMIAVRGAKSVRFEKCVFVQPKVPEIMASMPGTSNRAPLASLLVDALDEARPVVVMKNCLFDGNTETGGQVAVAINGATSVYLSNTAFRPHGALFSFREKCTREQTAVQLENCAGYVEKGPVFRFNKKASSNKACAAQVGVQQCFFSRSENWLTSREGQPGLIFLGGDAAIQYEGHQNLYHALNALVEKKDTPPPIGKGDEFQKYLETNKLGADVSSVYLGFAEPLLSPLQHAKPLSLTDARAFQLKEKFAKAGFGLQETWTGQPMPEAEALVKVAPREKLVDADDGDRTPGVFRSIAEALANPNDGDVIYIKHGKDRRVIVSPVKRAKENITVTLKPFKDCQPILVMDKDIKDKDNCLFSLQAGTLQVKGMEILLDPGPAGYETQSVVHLGETARCSFENCTFTLRGANAVKLNVVTFLDLNQMVKMETPTPPAKVDFQECFVRGRGHLVALRGCRLLHVEVKNSLIALAGSLLDIKAGDKAMAMTQGVQWKMERSSIFTNEPIFALHSKSGTALTETHADFRECLLASLTPEQPVVLLDMAREDKPSKYLRWECDKNYYANFENLKEWEQDFREVNSKYGKLAFPKLNDEALQTLWEADPDWFNVMDADKQSILGFGVPPESEKRLLPKPPAPDED